MGFILGLDFGTSGAKALLMSTEGKVVDCKVSEYNIASPQFQWAEEDPNIWWNAVKSCLFAIKKEHPRELSHINIIGLSGQMHGAVFVDNYGIPLYPCILWADNRTEIECEEIIQLIGKEKIYSITANPVIPAYTAPKILWFKKNKPDLYEKTYKILMPKDYIGYKLTGKFYTDFSDASGTLLFDLKKKCWSHEIFQKLQLDVTKHPEVKNSWDIIGNLAENVAIELGLPSGIPVIAGGGDLACGAIGNANIFEGIASVTIGTSGQVVMTMDKIYNETLGKLYNFCHIVQDKYFSLASIFSGGLSLKWFKNNVSLIENIVTQDSSLSSFDLLLEGIEKIPAGSNGLLFLPYLDGCSIPYMDLKARGVFFGLTSNHGKKDMVRAIIEGISFGIKECLEIINEMGIPIQKVIISAGGAKNHKWRQIQADVYNSDVSLLNITDTSPYGAAILASYALGNFDSIEAACRHYVHTNETLVPNESNVEAYKAYYGIYKQIYPSLQKLFKELSILEQKRDTNA
jgi:D-xylulose kinase